MIPKGLIVTPKECFDKLEKEIPESKYWNYSTKCLAIEVLFNLNIWSSSNRVWRPVNYPGIKFNYQ